VCLSREIPQNHFKKDKITVLNIKIFGWSKQKYIF
jgi:hypothetical protein